MPFQLTFNQQAYLKQSLDKVSRSFALVIAQVDPPLGSYLATAYLICRVVDNIEDTRQSFAWQQARFTEFRHLLVRPEAAVKTLTQWQGEQWPGLNINERQMMGMHAGYPLWKIYATLPQPIREIIARWAKMMVDGMERVLNPQSNEFFTTQYDIRLPWQVSDYNQYCYYVAGTVGRMATELVVQHYGVIGDGQHLLLTTSEICGRALQKTNIIKDFAKDLDRGVSYLPDSWQREIDYSPLFLKDAPPSWKQRVLNDVLAELDSSAEYVVNLPALAIDYRQASLLSMFPAYQTLLLAAQHHQLLFTPRHQVKISRATMMKCLADARNLAHHDQAIRDYGRGIRNQVQSAFAAPEPIPAP